MAPGVAVTSITSVGVCVGVTSAVEVADGAVGCIGAVGCTGAGLTTLILHLIFLIFLPNLYTLALRVALPGVIPLMIA